jgi:hypothetical protein
MRKKKKIIDVFETQCWFYGIITDPYQVFAECFSHAGLPHFRRVIKKLLHHAESEKIYQAKSPCDVLFYMKIIRSLIKAADVLKKKEKSPVEVSEMDVFDKRYFRSHYQSGNELEEFPRMLSVKEFCNPYRAFHKFFKYQPLDKWLHDWEEAVECALSRSSGELGLEMLKIYSYLGKLLEAAHLINVREVTHVGGLLKNRFIQH